MPFEDLQPQGIWSEEEMRYLEPPARPRRALPGGSSGGLRQELSRRNLARAAPLPHDLTRGSSPSVIYAPGASKPTRGGQGPGLTHGNFMEASYRRICAHPEWRRRLTKAHSAKRQGRRSEVRDDAWRELDSANSSDALLMNIFCYPRLLTGGLLPAMLGVDPALEPVFGFMPRIPRVRNLTDMTEIDMRLGDLLVEAKLTEAGFQTAPMSRLERYRDLDVVFDRARLALGAGGVRSYQLIRGVLAAHATGTRFCVLSDARRPELIEAWYQVILAVEHCELRSRLTLRT